jgi:hypothetical protein
MYVSRQAATPASRRYPLATWGSPAPRPRRRPLGAYLTMRGLGDSSMQPGQTVPNAPGAAPNPYPAPISAQDAAAYCNAADISSIPGFSQAIYDNLIQAVESGQIIFTPSDTQCSGVPQANPLTLVTTGTGLALTTAGIVGTAVGAGSVVPVVGSIVGAIVGLFVAILEHHAEVTKAEQNAECALIPAANNYLTIIYNAVSSGQQTPAQGVLALQSLFNDFIAQAVTNPSYKDSGNTECSALCVYAKQLCAIVNYWVAQYQNMPVSAETAAVSGAGLTVGGTTFSTPELLIGALVAWLLFF